MTCHQCGQQAFTEATTLADMVKPDINLKNLMLRLLVAAAVLLIVSGISIYVAWGNASDSIDCRWEQYLTQRTLKSTARFDRRIPPEVWRFPETARRSRENTEPRPVPSRRR